MYLGYINNKKLFIYDIFKKYKTYMKKHFVIYRAVFPKFICINRNATQLVPQNVILLEIGLLQM